MWVPYRTIYIYSIEQLWCQTKFIHFVFLLFVLRVHVHDCLGMGTTSPTRSAPRPHSGLRQRLAVRLHLSTDRRGHWPFEMSTNVGHEQLGKLMENHGKPWKTQQMFQYVLFFLENMEKNDVHPCSWSLIWQTMINSSRIAPNSFGQAFVLWL